MKEQGLYYSDKEESYRKVYSLIKPPEISFDRPNGLESEEWFDEVSRRLKVRRETEDSYDYARLEFKADRPVVIGITGDWHLGATIDTEMLKRDVDLIANHPLVAGAFFMGDLTDSANFNPAQDEDVLSYEEQRSMMVSILNYIGKDRVLAFWKGNHDHKWESKNGTSKYQGLSNKFKAPVFYGNAFVDMYVNDINYRLMGSHRLRGNSIYNNAHPAIRGHREVQGLDLTFAGHIHKKGHIEQPVREFNDSRLISGLISGTYQLSSGYTKDTGFGNQRGGELGMYWVMFGHDGKYIQIMDTQQFIKRADKYI